MTLNEYLENLSLDELRELHRRMGRDIKELILNDLAGFRKRQVCYELRAMGYTGEIESEEI